MDEAVARFEKVGHDGIIICFDADSLCDENYLVELENHFKRHPKTPGCSIYFEHPVAGDIFNSEIYEGIINYELHLRYYNQCLRFCNLPYAFHTVGSSMAVRSSAYQKQGGMNKRKAGEDFYFLHKIIQLGNFSELKSTRVIPSPRISDRVPFGTGKAIGDWVKANCDEFRTYSFLSFQLIKEFIDLVPDLFLYPFNNFTEKNNQANKFDHLFDFLKNEKFELALEEIKKNSTDLVSFTNRFFRWFDAFRVLKLIHYLRDNQFQNSAIVQESLALLQAFKIKKYPNNSASLLEIYRQLERKM
jgi:hypothetical protein